MNVYDFDGTVFHPDSSYCFFLFCLRRWPRAVLKVIPPSLIQMIRYLHGGKEDAQKLKEALFSFLNRIEDPETAAEAFWELSFDRIESWYLQQKRSDDLVISASPEFLLTPAVRRLGVRLIATPMNPYTGRIEGKNCHDREKCRRFLEAYPGEKVEEFYSDSLSDTPMAELAEKAFLVKGPEIQPWP
ncbi:MAG: haloacid dehalogenase-like hydrolase [Oscillospiraceae bacterium]|nr:haloacid dehalogenase-like hydrolase [Oscillospiraceae bacterium]